MKISVETGSCITTDIKILESATIDEAIEVIIGALLMQGYSLKVIMKGMKKILGNDDIVEL